MKTYTITCHNVYNYGASLQAFALNKYLNSQGYDNVIINYMPDYLSWHFKFSWWISARSSHYSMLKSNPLLRFLFVTLRFLRDMPYLGRKHAFDRFSNKYLRISEICNKSTEINRIVQDAEVLIAGSDQIWNSFSLENGRDPLFYLDFGPDNAKRISYAASFGANIILNEYHNFVVTKLACFDAISVRESKGFDLLASLGFKSSVVVDPVFLLDRSEWVSMVDGRGKKSKYILVYAIGGLSDDIIKMALLVAEKTGYEVICIRSNAPQKAFKEIKDAGPIEFISLIANAEYVISNSFHATAFSIIFEKEFYTFAYSNKESSERLRNLLDSVHLLSRYNSLHLDVDNINYADVRVLLNTLVNESKKWITLNMN